ncbi:hypothetical protein SBA2_460032 [Acidobacteriia bacterium SbA2]|nr:hypothetical protein SBA2_460032 [Acidobacteriia bacterium SbA2]
MLSRQEVYDFGTAPQRVVTHLLSVEYTLREAWFLEFLIPH